MITERVYITEQRDKQCNESIYYHSFLSVPVSFHLCIRFTVYMYSYFSGAMYISKQLWLKRVFCRNVSNYFRLTFNFRIPRTAIDFN